MVIMTTPLSHHANYSPERRATALSWIHGEGLLAADLTEDARLLAVIGLLICDDQGRIPQTALKSAMRDQSVIQTAHSILREARAQWQ